MAQATFKNKTMKVEDLIPYALNSRTHSEEQITELVGSIHEFGFTQPVLVDEKNTIIAGHGRIMAAKKAGLDEVPAIICSGWSEAQKKAYIIADNKLALKAGWDEEILANELEAIMEMGYDPIHTGFDRDEIDEMVIMPEDKPIEGMTDDDAVPAEPEKPATIKGDVWLLGEHVLMCGDSTAEPDVKKLAARAQGAKVHCISDPPYGIAYNPKGDKYGMIENDDTFLDYVGLADKYTNGFFLMWTGYQVVDEWMRRTKEQFGKITNIIIWHKGGGGMGDCARTLAQDYEIALVVNRGNDIQSKRIGAVWNFQPVKRREWIDKAKVKELREVMHRTMDGETVWKVGKDNTATYLHPTQKPVDLNMRALEHFTAKGDTVLDLFLGSGGNLVACEKMGRQCLGMEVDPKYCDVIIQRWQEFTGNDAVHAETKTTFDEAKIAAENM